MTKQLRALVGARVSIVKGPQKVSHLAQIESTTRWAEANGYQVVGSFEDLNVSAEKRPEDRPDLGKWLTDDGASHWDAIVWSKMDRAFRSTRHCVDFARWAEERHKIVVFADDGLKLDYRPGAAKGIDAMMAELFVYLGSFFAQLELNRFKSRVTDSHRNLRQTTRWASGVPPLGFRVVPHPSGKGKGLATDTEGKELLYGMAKKLLDGWSFIRIAKWLNETGAQTNKARAGDRAATWTVSTVIDALTSPRTQGLKLHKGETVLDGAGAPIVMAKPTFDPDHWQQIQDAAALRKQNQRTPTGSINPMLGVGTCGRCGRSLAQHFAGERRYYRCARKCARVFLRGEIGDELLEETFLDRFGGDKIARRVFVPGEDHSHELDRIKATIDRLRRESDAGLVVSDDDELVYLERMKSLIEQRTKLEAMPIRSAGFVIEESDQTYREVWSDPSTTDADRHTLLIDRGVKFVLNPSPGGKGVHIDLLVP